MNIEQFRAIKAQESATPPTPVTPPVENKPVQIPETKSIETKPVETKPEEKPLLHEKVMVEGVGEVTLDELRNGYLRQADYTRKTQEVSRKAKEVEQAVDVFEKLKANPQLTQQIFQGGQVPATLDPVQGKVIELETKLYDMMLEREIESLQGKYPDFEVREVLQMAQSKNITNLEDAYLLVKSHKEKPQNLDEVKKQLRQELLKEMEQERSATQTIISPNDGASIVPDNTPKISDAEKKVASMMKMSEADYIKWRDMDKKKK